MLAPGLAFRFTCRTFSVEPPAGLDPADARGAPAPDSEELDACDVDDALDAPFDALPLNPIAVVPPDSAFLGAPEPEPEPAPLPDEAPKPTDVELAAPLLYSANASMSFPLLIVSIVSRIVSSTSWSSSFDPAAGARGSPLDFSGDGAVDAGAGVDDDGGGASVEIIFSRTPAARRYCSSDLVTKASWTFVRQPDDNEACCVSSTWVNP